MAGQAAKHIPLRENRTTGICKLVEAIVDRGLWGEFLTGEK